MTYLGAFCAMSMTGIIWYVQLVQYPLFARVGDDTWFADHADHERRTGWVVAPLTTGFPCTDGSTATMIRRRSPNWCRSTGCGPRSGPLTG